MHMTGEKIQKRNPPGFTLAELLIALAILGVIATFTIPKILDSGSNAEWNAKAKETIAMYAQAFEAYKVDNTINASTNLEVLLPYLNYAKIDSVGNMDHVQTASDVPCTPVSTTCIVLHNGGKIQYVNSRSFGDTQTTNALTFLFDPDGKYSGTTTGPGKSVRFFIYYNGRITSSLHRLPNTYSNALDWDVSEGPIDPPWFS